MSKAVEEMSRGELEDEVTDLRERMSRMESIIEIRGADSPEDADVKDIWICGHPIGKTIQDTKTRSYNNNSKIEDLQNGQDGQEGSGVSSEARSKMVEAHRKLVDWQDGAASDLGGRKLRAVVFFRQFIRNLDDDRNLTGISAEHGKFKLKSERATYILEEAGLLPDTNPSTIKKRAMKKLVRMSTKQDCDCDKVNCQHAMFHFKNENEYILTVDQEVFLDYVASVQSAIEGVEVAPRSDRENTATDDGATGDTAPEDTVDEEFDRILSALTEDEVTNSGVSGVEESALVGGDPPQD